MVRYIIEYLCVFLILLGIAISKKTSNKENNLEKTNKYNCSDILQVDMLEYCGYGCCDSHDVVTSKNRRNAVLESLSGFGCGSSCGAGRENGYSALYQSECKNWQLMPLFSPLNQYWIDESTLINLTDVEQELFITNVINAAEEWNNIRIGDCITSFVNLQRQSNTGINVVKVKYDPLLEGALGEFVPNPLNYEIKIKNIDDYDTIVHEFGHMIGLQDLDMNNDIYTHISLMGYAGNGKMHYQDIQGAAVANGGHVSHDYRRYWKNGNIYNYMCFYCDAMNSLLINSGGLHLENASSCIHNYEELASSGNRHWQKCTKCYKVIESNFLVNAIDAYNVEIEGMIDTDYSSITIPATIGGQYVKRIGNNAFLGNETLTSIFFEYGSHVTAIGNSTFKNCSNLRMIIFPEELISIGQSAFEGCASLESIQIPINVTSIGNYAFKNCTSLVNVSISRKLSPIISIGNNVFYGCDGSLVIEVPKNRICDYKNKLGWYNYRAFVLPNSNNFLNNFVYDDETIYLNDTINAGYNKLYRLYVIDQYYYSIIASANNNVLIELYDNNMVFVASNLGKLSCELTEESTYYVSVSYQNTSNYGTISTQIKHTHDYDYLYTWISLTEHREYCYCGLNQLGPHIVSPDAFQGGLNVAPCLLCNGFARIGEIYHDGIGTYPYTLNGSFILPNGVIVLANEDFDAYMNGTLVFIIPNENIDRGVRFIPGIIRREDNCWIDASK